MYGIGNILRVAVEERSSDVDTLGPSFLQGQRTIYIHLQFLDSKQFLQVIRQGVFLVCHQGAFHQLQCLEGVAIAHHSVAHSREVPGVCAVTGTTLGGDDMRSGNGLRHLCHYGIVCVTRTSLILAQGLADEERNVLGLQAEVCEHVVIDFLDHGRPVGVAIIGTTLMQQDAFDDSDLLCLLCHVDKSLIRVAAIVLFGKNGPPLVGVVGEFLGVLVLVEHLDRTATHGDSHHTHFHLFGQSSHEGASKIVRRAKFANGTDDGNLGGVPFTQGARRVVEFASGQHFEARIHL